jgi:hypothetical protein
VNCRKYIAHNNLSLIPDKFINKRKLCELNHLPSNALVLIPKNLENGETKRAINTGGW